MGLNRVALFTSDEDTMSRWTITDRRPGAGGYPLPRRVDGLVGTASFWPNYIYRLHNSERPRTSRRAENYSSAP